MTADRTERVGLLSDAGRSDPPGEGRGGRLAGTICPAVIGLGRFEGGGRRKYNTEPAPAPCTCRPVLSLASHKWCDEQSRNQDSPTWPVTKKNKRAHLASSSSSPPSSPPTTTATPPSPRPPTAPSRARRVSSCRSPSRPRTVPPTNSCLPTLTTARATKNTSTVTMKSRTRRTTYACRFTTRTTSARPLRRRTGPRSPSNARTRAGW
jgi:hypothetical protein